MSAAEKLEYDNKGRLRYHPDFHPNQGRPWKQDELEYICAFYHHDDLKTISYALGRTEVSIRSKLNILSRRGLVEDLKKSYFERLRS